MISNEIREYLIDFFNWFPVEDRQTAIKSLVGMGDHAVGLYEKFKEKDRQTMDDIHRMFGHDPIKVAYFESRSPGHRCFLWESITRFLLNIDDEEDFS